MPNNDDYFSGLSDSIKEAGEIKNKNINPSRIFHVKESDFVIFFKNNFEYFDFSFELYCDVYKKKINSDGLYTIEDIKNEFDEQLKKDWYVGFG